MRDLLVATDHARNLSENVVRAAGPELSRAGYSAAVDRRRNCV
jgi:hypothetical protein